MATLSTQTASSVRHDSDRVLDQLKYLWDEYKYRHNVCWDAVYKVTAAVVALGIVPYVDRHLADRLDWYLLLPPLLGTMFAIFSFRVIRAEFSIWDPIRTVYNDLQRQYCVTLLNDDCERRSLNHKFETSETCKKRFGKRVTEFLACLIILSAANCLYVGIHCVPSFFTAGAPIHFARPWI